MESKTDAEIESIDVANDDLIAVLAKVAEYHRTRGASTDPRLAVVGDGARRALMPTATNNVVEDTTVRGSELVSDGELNDSIEIEGNEVEVQVL